MTIIERLERLIKEEGSQANFSRKTGIHPAAVSGILKRGGGMSSNNLEQIAIAYPNLNLRWLLIGEGEMWTDGTGAGESREVSAKDYMQKAANQGNLLNELMLRRIRELERELKRVDPEGAKELGIE